MTAENREHWRTATLGEVADVNWGDTSTTKSAYTESGYPAFSASGNDGKLPYADFDRTGVVVSAIGANCGATWLAKGKWSCIKNTLRFWATDPEVDTEYLYWATRNPDFWPKRGSAQPFISQGDARATKIVLPPSGEQRAIASILGALNDKIEQNRRTAQALEKLARAIFRAWFVDFEPVKAKAEGRTSFPSMPQPVFDALPTRFIDSDIGPVPEGWEVKAIGDLANIKGGKQLARERFSDEGKVPVFGGAGIMGHTVDHNADGFVISVGRVGAYCGQFFSYRGKAWINNNASLIVPRRNVPGEWLFLALGFLNMEIIKKGAAQPFVSNSDIAKMRNVWPSNRSIASFMEIASPLLHSAEATDGESRKLAHLRDYLLPRLLSGTVRVGAGHG